MDNCTISPRLSFIHSPHSFAYFFFFFFFFFFLWVGGVVVVGGEGGGADGLPPSDLLYRISTIRSAENYIPNKYLKSPQK